VPYSERRRRFYQRFAKVHGALLVRTKGRPRRLGRNQYALVLETVGAKTGQVRTVPLLYMPDGDERFVVVASNYGQERPPAWWANLRSRPDAHIYLSGKRLAVRWHLAAGDERDALIPRITAYNKQQQEYFSSVQRELPIVVLERAGP
jgi:deazaflavin-dependent oxidoreductase (nitroreductase family)